MADCYSSTPNPASQPTSLPDPLLVMPYSLRGLTTCARATTVLAMDPSTGRHIVCSVGCKAWRCPICSKTKIRRLAAMTALACPNKLLTLTVNPALYTSPADAWTRTSPFVPELIRALRVRYGSVEYLRVTEQTAKGWPHYHLMLRSDFLPQAVIQKIWEAYTAAKIVDIRQTTNKFGAYQYLVKYLTKLHRLDWTERHVSYSRRFFPPGAADPNEYPHLTVEKRIDEHPWVYLANNYEGELLPWSTANSWIVSGSPHPGPEPYTKADLEIRDYDIPIPVKPNPQQPNLPI